MKTSTRTMKALPALNVLKLAVASVMFAALMGCNSPESKPNATDQTTESGAENAGHDSSKEGMDHSNMSAEDMKNMDHSKMSHDDMNPTEPTEALGKDYSIYQIGGDWVDHTGKAVTLDELKGKNQVVVMAYTSCQHTCPILVRSMKQMYDEMTPEARDETQFLIATLDTKRDTPEVMANYAEHNDLGDNWRLIRSDEATTRMLANTLNIKYKFADNGDINHSNLISILDKEGRLVAQGIGVSDSGIKPLIEYLNTHSQ